MSSLLIGFLENDRVVVSDSVARGRARGASREQIPVLAGVPDDGRQIIGKNITVLGEGGTGLLHERQEPIACWVPLVD
jgi:hypothetical protein